VTPEGAVRQSAILATAWLLVNYDTEQARRLNTMTSLAVKYVAMVTAVENDDVDALKHLLQTGADVNANLDDDIGTRLLRICHIIVYAY